MMPAPPPTSGETHATTAPEDGKVQPARQESVGRVSGPMARDLSLFIAALCMDLRLMRERNLASDFHERMRNIEILSQGTLQLGREVLDSAGPSDWQPVAIDLAEAAWWQSRMLGAVVSDCVSIVLAHPARSLAAKACVAAAERAFRKQCLGAPGLLAGNRWRPPEFFPGAIRLPLAGGQARRSTGRVVCLQVSLAGYPLEETSLWKTTVAFYSAREPSQDTGLEVASVHDLAQRQQGWLALEVGQNQSLAVRVYVPEVAVADP
jgi:hypothetical protein